MSGAYWENPETIFSLVVLHLMIVMMLVMISLQVAFIGNGRTFILCITDADRTVEGKRLFINIILS